MTTQLELVAPVDWLSYAAAEIPRIVRSKGLTDGFTADDVRGQLDTPLNHNLIGQLFRRLCEQGVIEQMGYRRSKRPLAGGHVVRVWRLK